MMARSTNAPVTGRIRSARPIPSITHIWLATHSQSIQVGSFSTFEAYAPHVQSCSKSRSHGDPIEPTLGAIQQHAMKDAVQQTVDLWRGLLTVQS